MFSNIERFLDSERNGECIGFIIVFLCLSFSALVQVLQYSTLKVDSSRKLDLTSIWFGG